MVLKKLLTIERVKKRILILSLDTLITIVSIYLAFAIRLGEWYEPNDEILLFIFSIPILAIPIFIFSGLYRTVIRHMDFFALIEILKSTTLFTLIWVVFAYILALDGIPRSVLLINWALVIIFMSSVRILMFSLIRRYKLLSGLNSEKKQVLIYGAGSAGTQVISVFDHSSEYVPIAFIDDSKDLQGQIISGRKVFSPDAVKDVIRRNNVKEIFISIPSLTNDEKQEVIKRIECYKLKTRILPGLSEIALGRLNINDFRKIDINDLLGRSPIKANKKLLIQNITNKVVMVTGAGGSIGSELCRQIVNLKPKALIMFELSEFALYKIEKELEKYDLQIYPILGNVNSIEKIEKILGKFNVDTIYHAAAYKHVPLVENNIVEGVTNNVFGTLNMALAALKNSVETFVLISTDKAVRPTNIMGASKRVSELILQALSLKNKKINFSIVRFGNVLGSSGSVIPLFEKQINSGGPVTVTHEDIIRYFMTIPEAVELVIQAGAMGHGADVFVLDMGDPVRIDDLARRMISLRGLEVKNKKNPLGDIEIDYIGLRPGEKLFEELLIDDNATRTPNNNILRAKEKMIDWEVLSLILKRLEKSCNNFDYPNIQKSLLDAVPEFTPKKNISDQLN